ncbi:MAG: recombinase family protein [Sedimentisphaerales bacterium]|nr:recombinase family protein [Sedimentisphaerales bacterium]
MSNSTISPAIVQDVSQTAVYLRVSTSQQTTRSQKPDLERWLAAQEPDKLGKVGWYSDTATGKNMDRPGWQKLQAAINTGRVKKLVVWRLDRLGRTASGLCKLFEDLQAKDVRLVSLKDSIDLGTASGRLIANVLASVAAYETEIRGERVKAGQAAAQAAGKTWGGSPKGRLLKVTDEQVSCDTIWTPPSTNTSSWG